MTKFIIIYYLKKKMQEKVWNRLKENFVLIWKLILIKYLKANKLYAIIKKISRFKKKFLYLDKNILIALIIDKTNR